MVFELSRELITKLYGLEVQVFSETDIHLDLVNALKNRDTEEVIADLGGIERHLLSQTIKCLNAKDPQTIFNKKFPVAGISPHKLTTAKTQLEYFTRLLDGYKITTESIWESPNPFCLQRILIEGDEEKMDEYRKYGVSMESNPETRLEILKLLAQDFIAIGEQISYGRLDLLYPYLSSLMNVEEIKRYGCIQSILDRNFPFTDDNRRDFEQNDCWNAAITSLISH